VRLARYDGRPRQSLGTYLSQLVTSASALGRWSEQEHEHEQEKGMMSYFLYFVATVLAGTIKALAGGGGLITFPLLMLVVTPVTADATSALALFFAYPTAVWRTRSQLEGVFGRGWLWLLLIPSVLGGLIGGVLLSRTDNRNFIQLVPWLVLVATVIIVLRPILVRRDETGSVHPDIPVALWPVAITGIFLVGLYGGYLGGTISHRANRTVVRAIVITIGFAASAYYFWKLYGQAVVRAAAE